MGLRKSDMDFGKSVANEESNECGCAAEHSEIGNACWVQGAHVDASERWQTRRFRQPCPPPSWPAKPPWAPFLPFRPPHRSVDLLCSPQAWICPCVGALWQFQLPPPSHAFVPERRPPGQHLGLPYQYAGQGSLYGKTVKSVDSPRDINLPPGLRFSKQTPTLLACYAMTSRTDYCKY